MKKTSIFNLGGNACYIDEDAAEVLKNYLDSLRKHFGESASTNEVMNDIEMRLWEIFNEHKRYGMQVVSMQEVDEAIAVLGKVEDFGSIDDKESDTKEAATNNSRDNVNNNGASAPLYPEEDFIKKKLFRNPDDKIIGGVASGLGTYLDISPMWMRISYLFPFHRLWHHCIPCHVADNTYGPNSSPTIGNAGYTPDSREHKTICLHQYRKRQHRSPQHGKRVSASCRDRLRRHTRVADYRFGLVYSGHCRRQSHSHTVFHCNRQRQVPLRRYYSTHRTL